MFEFLFIVYFFFLCFFDSKREECGWLGVIFYFELCEGCSMIFYWLIDFFFY